MAGVQTPTDEQFAAMLQRLGQLDNDLTSSLGNPLLQRGGEILEKNWHNTWDYLQEFLLDHYGVPERYLV